MHPLQGMQQTMQRVQQQNNPLNQMQRAQQHPHTSMHQNMAPNSQRVQQFGHQAAPQVSQIGSVTLQRLPAVSSQSQPQPNVQVLILTLLCPKLSCKLPLLRFIFVSLFRIGVSSLLFICFPNFSWANTISLIYIYN